MSNPNVKVYMYKFFLYVYAIVFDTKYENLLTFTNFIGVPKFWRISGYPWVLTSTISFAFASVLSAGKCVSKFYRYLHSFSGICKKQ